MTTQQFSFIPLLIAQTEQQWDEASQLHLLPLVHKAGKRRPSDGGSDELTVVTKRAKFDTTEGTSKSAKEECVSTENCIEQCQGDKSDEEFQLDSEKACSDTEDDSSDIEEDSNEPNTEPTIVSGLEVQLQEVGNRKFRLFHNPFGRDFKMVVSAEDRENACSFSKMQQKNCNIPVLEGIKVDIPRDNKDEVMAYVQILSASTEMQYPYDDSWVPDKNSDEDKEQVKQKSVNDKLVLLEGNVWTLVKLEDYPQLFATGEFLDDCADH